MRGEQFGKRRPGSSQARAKRSPISSGNGTRSDQPAPGNGPSPPPATRERPAATRLATLMFCFCSYTASPDRGVKRAVSLDRRHSAGDSACRKGRLSLGLGQECAHFGDHPAQRRAPQGKAHVIACRARPLCRPHDRARAPRAGRRSRPCATRRPGSAPAACRRSSERAGDRRHGPRSVHRIRGYWCWS